MVFRQGSKVRLKANNNKEGIVVEYRREGFASVLLLPDMSLQWYPIDELEDASNELIDRIITGRLDDTIDFVLAMDAYRLITEYRFNPYVLASSTKIQIFPHQIDEVVRILDSNARMLIADEVGLGKTITAALIASELKARGLADKMLFVVPKSLVLKWRDELRDRFEFNVEVLDSNYVNVNQDELKKRNEFCYVTSMDYLKQDYVISRLFGTDINKGRRRGDKEKEKGSATGSIMEEERYQTDVKLDLVVIDEAHKLAKNNERYRLGRLLAGITNYMLLLTATPHNGDDEDYINRLKLLDPYISEVQTSHYLIIRNMKEDVIDLDGKEVFPRRESKTVEIPLSREEVEVLNALDNYLRTMESYARDKQEESAIRFISTIFRKRASSSFHALKLSLEKRTSKLSSTRLSLSARLDPTVLDRTKSRLEEAEEENDEEEYEASEKKIIDQIPIMKDYSESQIVSDIMKRVGNIVRDSKLEELIRYISNIRKDYDSAEMARREAKVVVFTEYRDTLNYIRDRLRERFPDLNICSIDGTMSMEDRKKALDDFKLNGDIMVCTDAAGEGIDMQFCNIMINYDVPWNPNKLEQRMGRIHRIKQKRSVSYYNFIMDPRITIDGYILSKLFEKVEKIREALGDRIYDIIGRMITEEEFLNLYEELRKLPKNQWEARTKTSINEITETRLRTLENIDGLITGYRLDRAKLEDMRKILRYGVDSNEVKRFVEVFVNRYRGKVEEVNKEESLYKIFMPRDMLYDIRDWNIEGIFTGSFNQNIAESKNYPYIALGNKHVMLMLDHAAKESVAVARFREQGALFVYRLTVIDGKGKPINSKIVSILCKASPDSTTDDVDNRIVWDFESIEGRGEDDSKIIDTKTILAMKEEVDNRKVAQLIKELMKDSIGKLNIIKKMTMDAIENYYSTKIDEIDKRIKEYKEKLDGAPHYHRLLKIEENKKKKYKREYEENKRRKEEEFRVYPVIELVGIALLEGGIGEEVMSDGSGDYDDERAKKHIELKGIEIALRYENERANNDPDKLSEIKDVSGKYAGYDIESFDRVIEVKAFKDTGSVELTSHEWATATKLKDEYYLYIVEDALGRGKITTVQNPANKYFGRVEKIPIIDYKYVIKDWR